ncbi:MAG: ATP-binding protein [Candidatus Woesearchaeota archaeon]
MRIGLKLTVMFTISSLIVMSLGSYGIYLYSRDAVGARIFDQLNSVAVLKETEINMFIKQEKRELEGVASEHALVHAFSPLFLPNGTKYHNLSTHNEMRQLLIQSLSISPDFLELFVMDKEGRVHLSTDEQEEGKMRSEEDFFTQAKTRTFVQSFRYDASTQKSIIIISTPLRNSAGNTIAVLAGKIDPDEVSEIMAERAGLGQSGETILVNRLNLLVTSSRFIPGAEFNKAIFTEAVKRCLKRESGQGVFADYRGVRSLTMYVWLPETELCLIAKMNEQEAMAPVTRLQAIIILIVICMIFVSLGIGLYVSKMIEKPIIDLKDAVTRLASGDLSTKVKPSAIYEFRQLVEIFNKMTEELKKSKAQIERHSGEMETTVDARTRELKKKVAELTGTKNAMLNMMEDLDKSNKELLEAQKGLKANVLELKKLDQEKDTFISIAAHELKTPMTAITGFAQLLESEKTISDVKTRSRYLGIIRDEVKRLAKLVTEVLDLSRLDLGTLKFTIETLDVPKMVGEVVEELQPKATARGLKLKIKVDRGIPQAETDKERTRQVLINLVDNAIKYSKKGTVEVAAKRDNKFVRISVADNGIGIPKEYFSKLFTRFYQIENPLTREVGGSGLGLSICKELIEGLGGRIWFESKLGKGSTFFFTIPFKPSTITHQEAKEI